MHEYYKFLLKKKITADQLLILYSLDEQVSYCKLVKDFDTLADDLIVKGYITFNKGGYHLTIDGSLTLQQSQAYFRKTPSKVKPTIMFSDWEPYVEAYRSMFPTSHRNNSRVLFERFKWFIDEYEFEWDVILAATEKYIESEMSNSGGMYLKKSMYFIKKEEKSGGRSTIQSVLADWCDRYKRGEIEEQNRYFGDNIV